MILLYEEHLPGGGLWSAVVRRHSVLRLTDLEGGVNAGLMMWNFTQPSDRLNLPDTLKAQYTAKLTRGHILMSDMGRALASIVTDTAGWHDPLGGHANAADTLAKYGAKNYQEARNDWHRNAHDNFLAEAGKHGLSPRDLHANVNFFSRLDADGEGMLTFHPGHSAAGSLVDLRAEMDLIVVITTCQHPMDPFPVYAPKPLLISLIQGERPAADDFCRTFRGENARSLALTERFLALPSL